MRSAARRKTTAPREGFLTAPALGQGALRGQRAAMQRENERDYRKKQHAKLAALRAQIQTARLARKNAATAVSMRCRTDRVAVREQSRMERSLVLQRLHDALHAEREAARQTCSLRKEEAKKTTSDAIVRARVEFDAEKKYQDDLRRIERGNRERRHGVHRASAHERRTEADDEVRTNISAELVPLFERVKRGIKGSARESRTEAFLRYAEEHPREVLAATDAKTDDLIRDLQRQQREGERHVKRKRYTAAELAAVPF